MNDKEYTLDRVVRVLITAAGAVAVLFLVRYLSDVLLPFAAAIILAYLLNPLVAVFEKKTGHRALAVGMTIAGLGLAVAAITVTVVPLMVGQAHRFRDSLENLREDLTVSAETDSAASPVPVGAVEAEPAERSASGWRELSDGWKQYRADADQVPRRERVRRLRESVEGTVAGKLIDQAVDYTRSEEFKALLVDAAKRLAMGGWTVLSFLLNVILGLTGLLVVLLYLVFLLLDFPEYARTWQAFLPPRYRGAIVDFLEQFSLAMRRYFRGQAIVALAMGLLFAVGFSIIGLPMAVPLGLFIGLLNMVPYLQIVGLVPAIMLSGLRALEHDTGLLASIGLTLLVFGVAQLIQDAVITPRVMGKATGLRPVAILLGVFVWGKLLGFLGLLVAIPLTCLGIAYYRRYILLIGPQSTKLPAGE